MKSNKWQYLLFDPDFCSLGQWKYIWKEDSFCFTAASYNQINEISLGKIFYITRKEELSVERLDIKSKLSFENMFFLILF